MTTFSEPVRVARPFGPGLKDENLKRLVAAADTRFKPKLRALIVRQSSMSRESIAPMAAELIVLNNKENIAALKAEAGALDAHGRLANLTSSSVTDVILESASTGERAMITAVSTDDFKRLEQIADVVQICIGGHDDSGDWVCRLIDSDRLDAVFSGRIIDLRD
jgi:hypothetical protein